MVAVVAVVAVEAVVAVPAVVVIIINYSWDWFSALFFGFHSNL